MISRFILVLVCMLAFISSGFAESWQYENQTIERVDIEPMNLPDDSPFDVKAVQARIKTRAGQFFSHTEFDNDLKVLAQDFDRVDPFLKTVDGKLYITLRIWPKPKIRTIKWLGNNAVSTKDLQQELAVPLSTVFDRQAFNKAFNKLKTYYVKKGFFEAELNYTLELDTCANEVDVLVCVNEGRAGRIRNIVFNGFLKCEEDEIVDLMATKTYNLFLSWMNDQGTYNEEAIQHDQYVILNHIQNKGYADAKVDIEIRESGLNRIDIVVNLERGELYEISKLTFHGNKLFCNEDIWKQIKVCENGPYSPDDLRESVRNIMDLYGRKGYIDCIVDYEPKLDCDTRTYSIDFDIEEGSCFRVGLIKVIGNCSTQTRVILHETLLIPGEIFNSAKLQRTEEKLRAIGYFKCVNVYAVKSEGIGGLGENYRDVHVEVEEQVTGNFGAGLGLSSIDSFFGELRITESNFNYRGFSNLFTDGYQALRGGGEYVHITTMIGSKSRKYGLSWTKPHFNDTPWVVGFDLDRSYNNYISNDYEISSTNFTLHGTYMNNQFLRTGLHYRIRNTHTTVDSEDAQKSPQLARDAKDAGVISAVGISLTYDSTDSAIEPRCGFRSVLEQEYAGVGGDHTYLSMAYLNSYFIPVGEKDVIKFKGDMRFIVPMWGTNGDDIPIDERLFLGGDSTIRGYRSYRLGPLYHHTDDPRGGMSLQMLSLEYARRYSRRFELFAFCDSGHLTFDLWGFGHMSTAIGFGARIRVFEQGPPLMVGMGFPINPRNRGEVKRFFFSVGGRF